MRVRQRVEARRASGETLAGCEVSAADTLVKVLA
jgi:hypothetical protein